MASNMTAQQKNDRGRTMDDDTNKQVRDADHNDGAEDQKQQKLYDYLYSLAQQTKTSTFMHAKCNMKG